MVPLLRRVRFGRRQRKLSGRPVVGFTPVPESFTENSTAVGARTPTPRPPVRVPAHVGVGLKHGGLHNCLYLSGPAKASMTLTCCV